MNSYQLLHRIIERLTRLEQGQEAIMTNIDALRAAESDLATAISEATTRVDAALAALQAKLDAAAPDLSPDIIAIRQDIAGLAALSPSPAPTPEPPPSVPTA